MFLSHRIGFLSLAVLFASLAMFAFAPQPAMAQEGQPLNLPCVTGVTVAPIGQAMPSDANGQALVVARLTIAPGGGFAAHTHPGTLVVSVESGTLDLTQLEDMPMDIMRAASGSTPATSETLTEGVSATLGSGDWFVETAGMVHTAFNNGSESTVVLLTGLVDPNQPLVQCVEGTPTS